MENPGGEDEDAPAAPRSPRPPSVGNHQGASRGHGGSSKYLFPSVRSWHRPISENTLNAALRLLGYDKTELTVHGLRSASSLLDESGKWHADAIERQLAHQEQNEVRGAYTHAAEFWQERVKMMKWWADHLDELRERGKVLKLTA